MGGGAARESPRCSVFPGRIPERLCESFRVPNLPNRRKTGRNPRSGRFEQRKDFGRTASGVEEGDSMKYLVTSAEASKILKKLLEEKNLVLSNERQSSVFNASLGEDMESVRPAYNYGETQSNLESYDRKIRILKHAVNCFNSSHLVGDSGMTIDQVLVYIPQLTEMRNRLYPMQNRLPKQRSSIGGIGSSTVIDYSYTNYSVEKAKEDYRRISDELRKIQTALDLVNTTVKMEFELPD